MKLEVEGKGTLVYKYCDGTDHKRFGCVIKCGSLKESPTVSGILHMIEHMMVNDVTQRTSRAGLTAECHGHTDFDHILICASWRGISESTDKKMVKILREVLHLNSNSDEILEKSRREVIEEIVESHERVKTQLASWSGWSDGQIVMHPVGKAACVEKIAIDDILAYSRQIENSQMVFFSFNIPSRIVNGIINTNYESVALKEEEYIWSVNNPVCYIKGNKECRYLIGRFKGGRGKTIERAILAEVLKDRYSKLLKTDFEVYEKRIDRNCVFLYLVLNSINEAKIEKITRGVLETEVDEFEMNNSKTLIKRFIVELNEQGIEENYTAIENKIVNNFLYDEDVFFLEDYKNLIRVIDSIELSEINKMVYELRGKKELC